MKVPPNAAKKVRAKSEHVVSETVEEVGTAASFLARVDEMKAHANVGGILAGMRVHAKHAKVQEVTCRVLSSLAIQKNELNTILSLGGMAEVVRAIALHRDTAGVQEEACWAVRCLIAGDGEIASKTADLGGIDNVLAVMKKHPKAVAVQECACEALHSLAVNVDNRTRIGSHGGIELISAAMLAHPKAAEVQQSAFAALQKVVEANEGNRAKATELGVVKEVLETMKAHYLVTRLQAAGCRLVSSLLSPDSNSKARAGLSPPENTGLVSLLREWNLEDECELLADKGVTSLEHLHALKPKDTVQFVSKTSQARFKALVETQLAGQEESDSRLLEMSVLEKQANIDGIVDSMLRLARDTRVQEEACAALGRLACLGNARKTEIVDAGGVEGVVEAIRSHPTLVRVKGAACWALWCIVLNGDGTQGEDDHESMERMQAAMTRVGPCSFRKTKALSKPSHQARTEAGERSKQVGEVMDEQAQVCGALRQMVRMHVKLARSTAAGGGQRQGANRAAIGRIRPPGMHLAVEHPQRVQHTTGMEHTRGVEHSLRCVEALAPGARASTPGRASGVPRGVTEFAQGAPRLHLAAPHCRLGVPRAVSDFAQGEQTSARSQMMIAHRRCVEQLRVELECLNLLKHRESRKHRGTLSNAYREQLEREHAEVLARLIEARTMTKTAPATLRIDGLAQDSGRQAGAGRSAGMISGRQRALLGLDTILRALAAQAGGDEGGCWAAAAGESAHSKDSGVRGRGLGAERSTSAWQDAGTEGAAIDGVLAAMSEHASSEQVQEEACRALSKLARDEELRLRIMRGGGVKRVLAAMAAHVRAEQVQAWGCAVLHNVAGDEVLWGMVVEMGDVEGIVAAVVAAMEVHPDGADTQMKACSALRDLSIDDKTCAAIVAMGGVSRVLAGMTRHADAAHLQEAACSTLRNFTLDVGNRAQFSGPEVIGQLLTTMQTHEQVAQVQAQACGALCNLAIANTPMQGMIVANGAIDRVLGAMKTHLESHGVQEEACKLLRILVTGPPHVQLRIAELGGIEQVVAAMKTHPTVSDVQEAACGLLLTLSSQAELAARVEVSGGLVCVKAAGAAAFATHATRYSARMLLARLKATGGKSQSTCSSRHMGKQGQLGKDASDGQRPNTLKLMGGGGKEAGRGGEWKETGTGRLLAREDRREALHRMQARLEFLENSLLDEDTRAEQVPQGTKGLKTNLTSIRGAVKVGSGVVNKRLKNTTGGK